MKSIGIFAVIMTLTTLLVGCAGDISPNDYNYQYVGAASNTVRGVIVSMRPVQVNGGTTAPVGAIAGGVAGAAAGSAIGNGTRAGIIGGVGGALLGGIAGNYIQNHLSTQTGIEYVVKTS